MCMFCASIPVAAATGTKLHSDARKKALVEGKNPSAARTVKVLTVLAIAGLLSGSIVVHTHFPRLG